MKEEEKTEETFPGKTKDEFNDDLRALKRCSWACVGGERCKLCVGSGKIHSLHWSDVRMELKTFSVVN